MPPKTNGSTQYSRVHPASRERADQEKPRLPKRSFQRYRSLVWMILSFISGVAFAVGHHFFYARFNDRRVDRTSISQNWIVRIGTGFAFVTQTLLVISASIAFVQYQWLTTRAKPFKIRQIDNMSSILGNVLGFFQSRIWLRFPVLTALAVVTW